MLRGKWILLLAAVPVFSGCASAPVQEMSDARSAIAAAQRVDADEKAPEVMRLAEGLLNKAQIEMEIHHYGRAREYAKQAKEAAVQARVKAQTEPTSPKH